jgi:hypothetical protein
MADERSGRCLCGAVRFTATPAKLEMDVCHCTFCQRWTGGVFMAVPCGDSLRFEDEAQLGTFKSSDYGERLFCRACGSSLAWRMQDRSHSAVSMQAFAERGDFLFAEEIFVDEKPATYEFANDTRRLTGAEVFAQFGANAGG